MRKLTKVFVASTIAMGTLVGVVFLRLHQLMALLKLQTHITIRIKVTLKEMDHS